MVKGYHIWAARIEAHLEANDLWEVVEEDYKVPPLLENPTVAQIKNQNQKKLRKSKARATLLAAVSPEICQNHDTEIEGMKILNLIREFELQKM